MILAGLALHVAHMAMAVSMGQTVFTLPLQYSRNAKREIEACRILLSRPPQPTRYSLEMDASATALYEVPSDPTQPAEVPLPVEWPSSWVGAVKPLSPPVWNLSLRFFRTMRTYENANLQRPFRLLTQRDQGPSFPMFSALPEPRELRRGKPIDAPASFGTVISHRTNFSRPPEVLGANRILITQLNSLDRNMLKTFDWLSDRRQFVFQVRVRLRGGALLITPYFDTILTTEAENLVQLVEAMVLEQGKPISKGLNQWVETVEIVSAAAYYEFTYFKKDLNLESYALVGFTKMQLQEAHRLTQYGSMVGVPVLARLVLPSGYSQVVPFLNGQVYPLNWTNGKSE